MIILQSTVQLADPHICTDFRNRLNILNAIFDALVRRDVDNNFIPALATSWQVEPDAKTWTFALRDGVTFHDGSPFTAADAAASLTRACDPAVGGELGTEGVWASYLGDAKITATGSHQLQIITGSPMADLLDLLVAIPIMPLSVLPDVPQRFIGSGPYQMVSFTDNEVALEKFPAAVTRSPQFETITFRAVATVADRIAALQNGTADLITEIDSAESKNLTESGHTIHSRSSNMCVAFLANASKGPCTDPRVRQAINYAANVSRMMEQALDNATTQLNGIFTHHHFGHDPALAPFPYDPEKARALFSEAGVTQLTIDVPTTLPDEGQLLASLLQQDLAAVGVTAELRYFEDRTAYAHMVKDKRIDDMCCFDSSPLSTYRVMREKINSDVAGPWWQGYHNPAVNTLLDQAAQTIDDAERQSIYRAAYRLISADAPWLFLYHPTYFWGASSKGANITIGSGCVLAF